MSFLRPVRLDDAPHPPAPVTIFDAKGEKVITLTAEEFRLRQMTHECTRHRVYPCLLCGHKPAFDHRNATERAADARKAARKLWTR